MSGACRLVRGGDIVTFVSGEPVQASRNTDWEDGDIPIGTKGVVIESRNPFGDGYQPEVLVAFHLNPIVEVWVLENEIEADHA